tara:strand:+ start:304 stop:1173 length:870 start_codon:yes stop_codon:yes gene_type:complete
MGKLDMDVEKLNVVDATEVSALLTYVSNKGLDVSTDILGPLYAHIAHHDLLENKHESKAQLSAIDGALNVHQAYAKLTKLSYPVTGKTILHSRHYRESVNGIKRCALIFLAIALITSVLGLYLERTSVVDNIFCLFILNLHTYVLSPLSPIFWGGLGSCIFLLKRFSDIAADRTFDSDFIGGWQTRVLLGAILGGVIQFVFDPGFIIDSGVNENALAFLVGVSVKVFYGALEKLIDAIAEKLNLNAIRRNKAEQNSFSESLVKRIAARNLTEEQRQALLALLDAEQFKK